MMAAFTAVVVVQWLWIKYAIRERETKFTSQVYDVLNRVVNRIDEFNYLRYKQEMNEQIGEIKNYNDLIASQQGGTSSEWYSNNLFNILNNDINRLKGERSYLFSVVPYARSGIGKKMDQEFIEQTIRSIVRLYPNKNPLFKLEKSEDFPDMIEADTVRLERCLRNLLENALKYSDDDVRITVTLTMKNNHYRIAIKDTGWGIPKKAQKKLGQQFFRVKQADKPAQPGYGLGLSSVMLMAKEMGGSLTFQSEKNVGSTFFINLPAENT